MRVWERIVSAVAVAVICGGVAYAYKREQLADTNLNPAFQEINRQYFDGELSGVTVEWSHLDQDSGQARKLHEYQILIDRNENTFLADVRDTLQHETCHVFVDWQEAEEHGLMFGNCMKRFE